MDEVYALLDQVFEWDRMKAARNAIKHGVRFPDAESVFFDSDAFFEPDPDHSDSVNEALRLLMRAGAAAVDKKLAERAS